MTQPPTAKVGVARGRCDLDLKTKPTTTTEKSSKLTGGRLKPAGRFFPKKKLTNNIKIYKNEIKLTTKSADLAQIFPS